MADQRQEQPSGNINNNNNQTASLVTTYQLVGIMRRYYTQTKYAELKRLLYDKTFSITQSFINLALVKETEQKDKEPKAQDSESEEKESESKFRDERINSFEDIHKPKEPIQIEQIFAQLKDSKVPQRILIEGRAGIGKTTLCQFIVNQWAAEDGRLKSWHDKFKLLIWLPLRELIADNKFNFADKKFDLAELIYNKFLSRAECRKYTSADIRAQLQELITKQQLVLLLDGYDEIVPGLASNNDFKEFFEEEFLACPNWILTSRPSYASNIQADRRLENIGFISTDIPIYAQQFFKDIKKENQVDPLLKLLESNKNIHGISHVPINLELICSAWEQEGTSLGASLNMTGLYDKLVLNLFKRYLHKFHQRPLSYMVWKDVLEYKKHDCNKMLQFIEQITWQGMQEPGIILSAKLLGDIAASIWTDEVREQSATAVLKDLGLLKSLGIEKISILDQEHYFIHLTFQEYFAARYVVNHLNEAAIQEFIRANKFNKRFEIVWWFVAGLLALNSTSSVISSSSAISSFSVISSASEKSLSSASAVALHEPASSAMSTEHRKEKSKLVLYFDLLSAEPSSLLLVHEQVLQWRCWDEAGLPDLAQKAMWLKNLFAFTQPRKKMFYYEPISNLIKLCLFQSPLLVQYYGSQLVPPWLALLQNRDWSVRVNAARMLEALQVKKPEVIKGLLTLLQDKDWNVRIAAQEMLVALQVKELEFIKELVALLQNKRSEVRDGVREILVALQVKEPEVIKELLALLQDMDWDIRVRAAELLGALQVKEPEVSKGLLPFLQNENRDIRAKAAMVLVALQVKEPEVIKVLLTLLQDKDGDVQMYAAEILIALQVKETWVIKKLVALLQDKDWSVRANVAEVLGALQVKEPKVIKGLLALLQDEDGDIRIHGAKALGALQVKEPEVIKRLLALLQDKASDVRVHVVKVLVFLQVKEPEVIKGLLVLMQDKDSEVRAYAAEALGALQVKESEVIQGLLALLRDRQANVRACAVAALGVLQVKEPEAIKELLVLLQDPQQHVQAKAMKVLGALQTKEPEVIKELLALLLQDKASDVRVKAAEVLGALQVKDPALIKGLLALLQINDVFVREKAAAVLEQLFSENELLTHLSEYFDQPTPFDKWYEFSLSLQLGLWLQFPQNYSFLANIVGKITNSETLVYYYGNHLYLEGKLTSLPMPVEQYQVLQLAIDETCRQQNIPIKRLELPALESMPSFIISDQKKPLTESKPQLPSQTFFSNNTHAQVKLLTINLLQGELFKHPSKEQQTILSIFNEAITSAQKIQKVKQLLDKERTLSVEEDDYKNILIHYAAFLGSEDLVTELLVANRGAAGSKNKYGLQALHIAAFKGHTHLVAQLMQSYGDASVLELDLAYEAQAFYISKPPQPIQFKIKCSTLGFAVLGGQVDVVKELLKQLQQSNKKDLVYKEIIIDGIGNILHLAVLSRHALILKTLVHHDFVIQREFLYNQLNRDQLSPLSLAVRIHSQAAIHILASHPKVKLNQLTKDRDRSVLHEAVKARNLEAIEVILNLISEGESALSLLNLRDKPKRDKLDRRTAHDLAVAIAKNSKLDIKTTKQYKLIASVLNGHDLTSWQQLREKPSVRRPRIRNLIFQGGGPRAIAFIEALRVLGKKLSDGAWSLGSIERVCGSSAGAITAGALALGYDADGLADKLDSLNLKTLLDVDDRKDLTPHIQKINEAPSPEASNTSSYVSILWEAFKDIFNLGVSDLLFHRQALWNKFQKLEGLCNGTIFLNWFNENIIVSKLKADGIATRYPEIDISNFTFKNLRYLINKGEPYKHLHLYVLCIEGELAEAVINSEDIQWDNVRVADAVRASISISGIFKPQIINDKKYMDAGLLLNIPIKRFDKVKYLNRYLKGDDEYEIFNEETLGFRLVAAPKSAADAISKINNPIDLLKALVSAFYSAEAIIAATEDKYQYRCIAIPDCDVGLIDFDLPETKKQELLTASSKATAEYFGEYEEVVRERQTIEPYDHPEDASQTATPMI